MEVRLVGQVEMKDDFQVREFFETLGGVGVEAWVIDPDDRPGAAPVVVRRLDPAPNDVRNGWTVIDWPVIVSSVSKAPSAIDRGEVPGCSTMEFSNWPNAHATIDREAATPVTDACFATTTSQESWGPD
jgi:hypothetical protein